MKKLRNTVKKIIWVFILSLWVNISTAQIGIGTQSPNSSAVLDLSSENKGMLLPRMTTTQRNQISNPATGLVIFNTTLNCLQVNNGTPSSPSWSCFGNPSLSTTSNGTAVLNSFDCNLGSTGTLVSGISASGVTQNIQVSVQTPGTYKITAFANGIQFSGNGTLTSTGQQSITLSASGIPITPISSQPFSLDVSPGCSFNRTIQSSTSNGTSIISGVTCSGSLSGNLIASEAITSVTKEIQVNVASVGTYSISALANGITFSASGTFTSTGVNNVTLIATGTPSSTGTHSFTLNISPNCSFDATTISPTSNGTAVFSSVVCSTNSTGTLTMGALVNAVSQTITVNASAAGTYAISTTNNGVTFSGSGTLVTTGAQNITLAASGTPISSGTHSYSLNVSPSCNFSRDVISPTSNGTAIISSFTCPGNLSGTLSQGVAASGVTLSIPVNVTAVGTYNLSSSIVNGLTLSSSGTFSSTGAQQLVLNVSGTPIGVGSFSYSINSSLSCSISLSVSEQAALGSTFTAFSNGTANFSTNPSCTTSIISAGHTTATCSGTVVTSSSIYNTVLINGQCWMKENLKEPSSSPCSSGINSGCNQWYNTTISSDLGYWGYYNAANTSGSAGWAVSESVANIGLLYQWSAAMNNSTTERAKGVCPNGWHIPSDCEWMYLEHGLGMSVTAQQQTGNRSSGNVGGKLSASVSSGTNSSGFTALLAGQRIVDGTFGNLNAVTSFWTSSRNSTGSVSRRYLQATVQDVGRSFVSATPVYSVRCLKD